MDLEPTALDIPGPVPATSPVMVGRNVELDRIAGALQQPPAVVLIEGEAGIGKSRLVRELATRLGSDNRFLVGHCHQLKEPFPLGPFIEALKLVAADLPGRADLSPVVGALHPLIPEMSALLPPPPPPLGDAAAERHRIFRAFSELLEKMGPTILVIEDLHWADETSIEFLTYLGPNLPENLGLVISYRGEETAHDGGILRMLGRARSGTLSLQLSLQSLGGPEVRELLGAILATDEVSVEFSDRIWERTSGIPFAIEEVLRLLLSRRSIVRHEGRWTRRVVDELDVPSGIRDSVVERLDNMSSSGRAFVRAAAVIGLEADAGLTTKVSDLEEETAAAALQEALDSALLVAEDNSLAFRHSLARQAVYEHMPTLERATLHLRAGRALETLDPKPLGQLAHHFKSCGHVAEWATYAEAAADLAVSLHDYRGACSYLDEVVSSVDLALGDRAQIALKLGQAGLYCGQHRQAIRILTDLVEAQDLQDDTRGTARCTLARLLRQDGDASAARHQVELAVADLEGHPKLSVDALAMLASTAVEEGTRGEHLDWTGRLLTTAEEIVDPVERSAATLPALSVYLTVGDPRGSALLEELPRTADSMSEKQLLARALLNAADALAWTGRYSEANRAVQDGLQLCEESQYVRLLGFGRSNQLLLQWMLGEWRDLQEHADLVREAASSIPLSLVDVDLVMGSILLARGEVRTAEQLLSSIIDPARSAGGINEMASAARRVAELRLEAADPASAMHILEPVLAIIRTKGIWAWATDVAPPAVRAHLALGDLDAAEGLVADFGRGLKGLRAPAASAALATCRALVATATKGAPSVDSYFARAHRAWQDVGNPFEIALAGERRGAALLESSDPQGEAVLRDSLAIFDGLGAARDAGRVRKTLRDFDVSSHGMRGPKPYGTSLSPREDEVARLLARGLTNRQISEALFLSIRTVEGHIASAMRKLGASSKQEIPGKLEKAGETNT